MRVTRTIPLPKSDQPTAVLERLKSQRICYPLWGLKIPSALFERRQTRSLTDQRKGDSACGSTFVCLCWDYRFWAGRGET